MPMQKRWFVVDPDGNISYSASKEAPEYFTKRSSAYRRAVEIAESEPGKTVYLTEASEALICPVGTIKRLGFRQS